MIAAPQFSGNINFVANTPLEEQGQIDNSMALGINLKQYKSPRFLEFPVNVTARGGVRIALLLNIQVSILAAPLLMHICNVKRVIAYVYFTIRAHLSAEYSRRSLPYSISPGINHGRKRCHSFRETEYKHFFLYNYSFSSFLLKNCFPLLLIPEYNKKWK